MQHVENNMDDLFRKAADNYMPDAGNSNWDVIQPQLISNNVAVPIYKNKRKKNKALLLILPLTAALFGYYFSDTVNKKSSAQLIHAAQNNPEQKSNIWSLNKTIHEDATTKSHDIKQVSAVKKSSYSHLNYDEPGKNFMPENISESRLKDEYAIAALPGMNNNTTAFFSDKTMDRKTIILNNINSNNKQQSSASKKIIETARQQKFYIGIIAGPEINQVKNQGFKKAGFNAGLIAGYQLNKNISLETGIAYKRKYYFSNGKYFNMKTATSMPAGMKVLSLEGCSNVLEIPLTIQYNIVHKNTSALFAAAGISSYILIKENNNYHASVNGVQQNLNGLYKHVSTGLASSVDVSAGYMQKVGKQSSLRIQPYLQIPIKGMGVGNMQVMSAGINVAVIHSFH